MKCPTCKLRKRKDKLYGFTYWKHEDDCPTGIKECKNLLPFEALGNPNHPAYKDVNVVYKGEE